MTENYCPGCGEDIYHDDELTKIGVNYCSNCEQYFYIKHVIITYEICNKIIDVVKVIGKFEEIQKPDEGVTTTKY